MSIQPVSRPFVSPDVMQAVKKLNDEGLTPTTEDICWLFSITQKQSETPSSLLCLPVVIEHGYIDDSDIIINQITPGIRMWWQDHGVDIAKKIFNNNKERIVLTLAYILVSGMNKEILKLTPTKLYSQVVAWSWSIKCSMEVLSVALLRAMGEKENGPTEQVELKGYDPSAIDTSRFDPVVVLSGIYGIDPLKILWEYSEEQIQKLVDNSMTVTSMRSMTPVGQSKAVSVDLKQLMVFRGAFHCIRDRLLKEKSV